MTHTNQNLLNHCIEQGYIKDESTFSTFLSSISERFLSQLEDDCTYVNEPLVQPE